MHGIFYLYNICYHTCFNLYFSTKDLENFMKITKPSELYDSGFQYIYTMIKYHFLDDFLVSRPLLFTIYYKINFNEFLFMLTIIYILREVTTSIGLL